MAKLPKTKAQPPEGDLVGMTLLYRLADGELREEVMRVVTGPDERGWYRLSSPDEPTRLVVTFHDYRIDGSVGGKGGPSLKTRRIQRIHSMAEGIAEAKIKAAREEHLKQYIKDAEKT